MEKITSAIRRNQPSFNFGNKFYCHIKASEAYMLSCIWKQHRKLPSPNLSWCVSCAQHLYFQKTQCFYQAKHAFAGERNQYCYIISMLEATMGLFFHLGAQVSKLLFYVLKFCLLHQKPPEASLMLQADSLPVNGNVESFKFVQIFCMYGRCVFPLPGWHMKSPGLFDRALEWRFQMPGWCRDSVAQVLCQLSPRGVLCVFLNGIFDGCFQLTHFWPGKGIE